MQTRHEDRVTVLQFAASFLWADHRLELAEEDFFGALVRELGLEDDPVVALLLAGPPTPEVIDPQSLSRDLARDVREVALRAIASDGLVEEEEMEMFFLLDELLPARFG